MAGSGRRVFQPGEVLTASNVMNYLQDQAVQVYAGTAARGSAIGTAVSEGMVSYRKDTHNVEAYTGSTWESLAYSANVPTNAQNGLTPVIPSSVSVNAGSGSFNSTTGLFTFSGASTVSLNGIFSSSYKNYRIMVNISAAGADQGVNARFRSGGTDYTFAVYNSSYFELNAGSGTFQFNGASLTNLPRVSRISGTGGGGMEIIVMSPAISEYTRAFFRTEDAAYYSQTGMNYAANDSFDGISIIGGAALAGTIQVYGMK